MTDIQSLLQSIKERADRAYGDGLTRAETIRLICADVPRLVEAVRVLAELAKEIEYAEEFGSLDAKYALQRATEILKGV